MKRKTIVNVNFGEHGIAQAVVTTRGAEGLTRDEQQWQHDKAVDNVVEALRELPYMGSAPLRNVSIK